VIGPRDNVFPGPAAALDGPDYVHNTLQWHTTTFIP